jgi:hypothetical protein
MPIISTFFGILIRINYLDHNPPHFHAEYQGFTASINIAQSRVMAGYMPPNAISIIRKWCLVHKRELLDNWDRAQRGLPLLKIPGADLD